MMGELERIEDQTAARLERGAWHGPTVLELLAGVTAAQAHARPIPVVAEKLHRIGVVLIPPMRA
jgi:hypothetical protein